VTSESQFTLASFLVSILKFDTRLRPQKINKKSTLTPLRIRQKTPYSESGFCPSLVPMIRNERLHSATEKDLCSSVGQERKRPVDKVPWETWWWWCYLTTFEGWRRGGTPRRSNSWATPQDLDQRSKMKELMPKMACRRGADARQSRRW